MKKLIALILIGIGLAGTVQAIRFDWSLGQPTEVLNNDTTSTSSDSVWWVLGQPTPVASTTIAGEAPSAGNPNPAGQFQCQRSKCDFQSGKTEIY